jgi:hypothetical protein
MRLASEPPSENAGAMSDTLELVASGLFGAAYFGYAWYKRKTQFGSGRLHHVYVFVGDRQLKCHACTGNLFYKREGLINTTWATWFKLDPLNESAHCVVCNACGYVHWFASRPGATAAEHLRYELNAPASSRQAS